MAKTTLMNPQGQVKDKQTEITEIYGKRQPKRPHYLREWIERRNFETDAEFAAEIGADKSVVSRWLDEDDPATPGKDWQKKLGLFFGDEESPADIFSHPDDDWMRKFLRNKSEEQRTRARRLLEAAFEDEETPKKLSSRT